MDLKRFFGNNKDQYEAATAKGNIFVIGNPGTGKTRLLTGRVAYLLDNGIKPEDILCMTFTNKASEELRAKMTENLGEEYPQIQNIKVETFHSFAINEMELFLEKKGIKTNVLREGVQKFLIYKVVKDMNLFNYTDSYLQTFVSSLSSKFSYLRSFELNKHQKPEILGNFAKRQKGSKKKKIQELEDAERFLELLPEVLNKYEIEKKKYGIDYNDMLIYFKEYLKENPISFKHVIVDEVQDTNDFQASIVLKLAKDGNYFAVGDSKQSIFRFQGASAKSIKRFKEHAKIFTLKINYRSTNSILNYAKTYFLNNVQNTSHNEELKDLRNANNTLGTKPQVYDSNNENLVVHLIQKYSKNGKDVAILARKNYQLKEISKVLDKLHIDYAITGANNNESSYIADLVYKLLSVLIDKDINNLIPVLSSPFVNLTFKELKDVRSYIEKNKITNIDKLRHFNSLKSFFIIYDKFNEQNQMYKSIGPLFEKFLIPSAISLGRDQYLTVKSIYDGVKEYFEEYTIKDTTNLIDYLKISNEVYELVIGKERAKIKLFTVHSAKGKEFDTVIYLPEKQKIKDAFLENLFDAIVLSQNKEIQDDIDLENYKLDFVAFTRAKENLIIINSKKRGSFDYFIEGVSKRINYDDSENLETIELKDSNSYYNDYSEIIGLLANKEYNSAIEKIKEIKTRSNYGIDWINEYIKNKRIKMNLSFSAIKNYLECPRKFLFSYILGLGADKNKSLEFGNKVHKKLELLYKGKIKLEDIKDNKILNAIQNAELCEQDLLTKTKSNKFNIVGIEYEYKYPIKDFINREHNGTINGKIDKILESGNKYYIIDYKTNASANAKADQLFLYKYIFSELNNISPENIEVYFYYINLKKSKLSNVKTGHSLNGIKNKNYEQKLQTIKLAIEDILFGDINLFYKKSNNCYQCPFEHYCKKIDFELNKKNK